MEKSENQKKSNFLVFDENSFFSFFKMKTFLHKKCLVKKRNFKNILLKDTFE